MLKKKEHPKFVVPNYGAKNRKRVKDRWRSQRGVDNKKKLKKSGYGKMPSIGYKNPDEVRFREKNGLLKVVVHNKNELETLIGKKEEYEVVLAHDLSKKKKVEIQRIAEMHGFKVANKVKV
ncbi:MAG: eL32 family ribosomal protein [Candidatus Micrarchaeia archaeon]|jgi:large subunit ribosomal protein L32e